MYRALWRRLPGPTWTRALTLTALIALTLFTLISWGFPWADSLLGPQEGTVAASSQPAPPPAAPAGTPTPAPTGATSTATAATSAAVASAKALFDSTNHATLASSPDATSTDIINALINAGFPKNTLQTTADTTTINLRAASIEFSAQVGTTCLVGQNGPDGSYTSAITPTPAAGRCLIGSTRPIP